jgi:hypothetical protein
MAVVINEFEVVPPPPPAQSGTDASSAKSSGITRVSYAEVERFLVRMRERIERLRTD